MDNRVWNWGITTDETIFVKGNSEGELWNYATEREENSTIIDYKAEWEEARCKLKHFIYNYYMFNALR